MKCEYVYSRPARTKKLGRESSWSEYNRVWDRFQSYQGHRFSAFEVGSLISPRGVVWRNCGKMWPDVGLWHVPTNHFRSVSFSTIMRAQMMGWLWVADASLPVKSSVTNEHGFTISRWPDGIHFYAELESGEEVIWDGKNKWDTHGEAYYATVALIASRTMRKSKN